MEQFPDDLSVCEFLNLTCAHYILLKKTDLWDECVWSSRAVSGWLWP